MKKDYQKPSAQKISLVPDEALAVSVSTGGAGTGIPPASTYQASGFKTVFNDDNTIDHLPE